MLNKSSNLILYFYKISLFQIAEHSSRRTKKEFSSRFSLWPVFKGIIPTGKERWQIGQILLKSRSRVFGQFRDSDTLVTLVVVAVIVCFVLQINSQMSVLEVALSTAKGEIGDGVSFLGVAPRSMLRKHMVWPKQRGDEPETRI